MNKIRECKAYLLLVAVMCLALSGCRVGVVLQDAPTQSAGETQPGQQVESSEDGITESELGMPETRMAETEIPETEIQEYDVVGPWHLDEEKNDLPAIEEAWETFPGYGEWGAGMEIRSDGHLSWYIGAVGGSGTYTVEGNTLHAELTDTMERKEVTMDLVIRGREEIGMNYEDKEIIWQYGDQGSE